jgi:hypothetical protein
MNAAEQARHVYLLNAFLDRRFVKFHCQMLDLYHRCRGGNKKLRAEIDKLYSSSTAP